MWPVYLNKEVCFKQPSWPLEVHLNATWSPRWRYVVQTDVNLAKHDTDFLLRDCFGTNIFPPVWQINGTSARMCRLVGFNFWLHLISDNKQSCSITSDIALQAGPEYASCLLSGRGHLSRFN